MIEDVNKKIKSISESTISILKTDGSLAKNSIRIFVLGSYKSEEDKNALKEFINILKQEQICAFSMEDIDTKDNNDYDLKFKAIIQSIVVEKSNLMIIMYAGNTACQSTGLIAEMTTITENVELKKKTKLYLLRDDKIDVRTCLSNNYKRIAHSIVNSPIDFYEQAKTSIMIEIDEIDEFLQYDKKKNV